MEQYNNPQNALETIVPEEPIALLEKDPAQNRACYPWRRYFARTLDLMLYSLLWSMFLAYVLHVNLIYRSGLGFFWIV